MDQGNIGRNTVLKDSKGEYSSSEGERENRLFSVNVGMDNFDLVESAPGGFILTDDTGLILEVDHTVAVILRTSTRRLIGKSFINFLKEEDRAECITRMTIARVTRQVLEWHAGIQLRSKDTFAVSLVVTAVPASPFESTTLRWTIRDISAYPEIRRSQQGERDDLKIKVLEQLDQLKIARQDTIREVENRKRIENALKKVREELENRVNERTEALAVANEMLQAELLERKRLEAETIQKAMQLTQIYSATGALITTLDLEPLLGQILDAAVSAIPSAEKGMIHLVARETGQLETRASIGYTDKRIQKFLIQGAKDHYYVAEAVSERKPLLVPDIDLKTRVHPEELLPETRNIRSAIVAPLVLNEEILGALSLESSQREAFNENDLRLLVTFAATVTIAIRNAQLHGEVQKLAITDTVTGVYNRRGFFELGKREVERARRFGRPLTGIMFDMDHFKDVNDTFGHTCGDQVLRIIAERIKSNIREVDIMGRYGGDEFTILLPETDLFVATNVAERLRLCVYDSPVPMEGSLIPLTISLGVARLSHDLLDLTSLLDRADAALYSAKRSGRNRVEIG